jgi:hypothetical protein
VHQVAPAIATGCPVIAKPAAATPLCCKEFGSVAALGEFEGVARRGVRALTCIYGFTKLDEAIEVANNLLVAFQARFLPRRSTLRSGQRSGWTPRQ